MLRKLTYSCTIITRLSNRLMVAYSCSRRKLTLTAGACPLLETRPRKPDFCALSRASVRVTSFRQHTQAGVPSCSPGPHRDQLLQVGLLLVGRGE